jgi:hypothetical protein
METLITKQNIEEFINSFVQPQFISIEEKEHTIFIYLYFTPEKYGNIHVDSLERLLYSEIKERVPVIIDVQLKVRKFEEMNPHEIFLLKESLKYDVVMSLLKDLKNAQIENNKKVIKIRRRQFWFVVILVLLQIILLFMNYERKNNNQRDQLREDNKVELFTENPGFSTKEN